MCKAYGQLPSDQLNIEDNWLAWDFNQAVLLWGNHVDIALDKCKTQAERERTLKRLLGRDTKKPETLKTRTAAAIAAQIGIQIIPKQKAV